MVKIFVVVVVNKPEVKVKLVEILMDVEFKITPPFVLFIINRVKIGVGVPVVALIFCADVPANVAVPLPAPNVIAVAVGDVMVKFPL